ncbi:hypothetical protein PLCT2_00431 [Planctomycetaceae bacterium]|nr:hypothetical protein PLCT2_00431 [Planctomycetaceae bacterium]
MRSNHIFVLIALVFGLSVGGAFGYWMGSSSDRSHGDSRSLAEDQPASGSAEQPAIQVTVDGKSKLETPGDSSKSDATTDGQERNSAAKTNLHDALKALEIAAVPKGVGVISGDITDLDGLPVEGFKLTLSQEVSDLFPAYPRPEQFKEQADYREATLVYRYICDCMQQNATQTVASDSAGKIEFKNLREVPCRLSFGLSEFMLENGTQTMSVPAKIGDTFHYRVIKTAALKVRVDAPDLPQNTSCQVIYKVTGNRGKSGSQSVKPNVDQELKLAPGTYVIQATCNRPKLIGSEHTVEVSPGTTSATLTLTLETPHVIKGTIHFPGGKPRGLSLLGATVSGSLTDEDLLSEGRASRAVRIEVEAATGTFAWDPGAEGQFVVGIRMGRKLIASQRVTISGQSASIEFTVAPDETATSLRLKVVRPEKTKLTNMAINVFPQVRDEYVRVEQWDLDTDVFLLLLEAVDERPMPKSAIVQAKTYELGTSYAMFRPGVDNEVTLTFEQPCRLRIKVTGLPEGLSWPTVGFVSTTNTNISGGGISLRHTRGSEYIGEEHVYGIQPGTYRAVISSDPGESFAILNQEVILSSGSQELSFSVPALSMVKLDGSSCKPYSHANIEQKSTGKRLSFVFQDNYTAIFPMLPPGEYSVTYTANGIHGAKKTVSFTVPGTETVVLTD